MNMKNSPTYNKEAQGFPESGLYGMWDTKPAGKILLKKVFFSRSFPAALACYMRDRRIPLMYASCEQGSKIRMSEIRVEDVFKCHGMKPQELEFAFFERDWMPFDEYKGQIEMEQIDLMVSDPKNLRLLSRLDIYLTVVPDDRTYEFSPESWGAELGISNKTVAFLILDFFRTMMNRYTPILKTLNQIFERHKDRDDGELDKWELKTCEESLETFLRQCEPSQKPIVMQCLWRTKGQVPILEPNAFDIVVWSNNALFRLMLDRTSNRSQKVDQFIERMARSLWELSRPTGSSTHMKEVFEEIVGTKLPGRAFSVAGGRWRSIVTSSRVECPVVKLEELNKIVDFTKFFHIVPDRQLQQSLQYMREQGMLKES